MSGGVTTPGQLQAQLASGYLCILPRLTVDQTILQSSWPSCLKRKPLQLSAISVGM